MRPSVFCSDGTSPASFGVRDFSVRKENTTIIKNITFTLESPSHVAIVGPNGGGKTTFLEALACPRHTRTEGIKWSDAWKKPMGYLPQRSEAQRLFPALVKDIVALGLWREVGSFDAFSPSHHGRIEQALDEVGLLTLKNTPIEHLSGGQFQRMLFARLSIQNTSFLLLDEPFTGIDQETQKDLIHVIKRWAEQGKTLFVVLHQLDLVRRFFPFVLMLSRKSSLFGPTEEILTRENIAEFYESPTLGSMAEAF